MNLISFLISGAFAAFRDPSVTSNQTSYYIPSKSAVVGILGAMVGIQRSDSLGDLYGPEYKEFFKGIRIGLQMKSIPHKITFFTNHRSFKESKTKPYKTELLENPTYRIFVQADPDTSDRIYDAVSNNRFTYSPHLGHAYCPARVADAELIETEKIDPEDKKTRCVVLDESEAYKDNFKFKYEPIDDNPVIVERHIHHFFDNGNLDARVLKHWIPTNGSEIDIKTHTSRSLSNFYQLRDGIVCIY